jgi:kinesin family protein 2/24
MMGSDMTGVKERQESTTSTNRGQENLGLYYMAALDIFHVISTPAYQKFSVSLSLFEIYGGKLFDLLNNREAVKCLEDSRGKVQFPGLSEHSVPSPDYLLDLINQGAQNRSTGTTSRNADSSRSHAILQLHLMKPGPRGRKIEHSRLSVIDLAGSERGADTSTASRATRLEGAEINTSLLALKEVIRALATGDSLVHVPFRGSKLTQCLKESFIGDNCRSV